MAPEHTGLEHEEGHQGHHGHEKEEHGEHGHHGHGEHEEHEHHGHEKKEPDPVPIGKVQIVGAFCGTVTTASHYMNISIPLDYEISIGHLLPLLNEFKEAAEASAAEAEALKGHKLIGDRHEEHHEEHHGEHHDEHHGEHHEEHHGEHHGEHHEEHHGEHHGEHEEEEEKEEKDDLLKAEVWQDLVTIFAGDVDDLAKVAQEEHQANVARKRPYKAKLEALKVDYEKKGVLLDEVQRQNAELRDHLEKLRTRINHELGSTFAADFLGHEVIQEFDVVDESESAMLTAANAIKHAAAKKKLDDLRDSMKKHETEHEHEKENIPANIPGNGLTIPHPGGAYSAGPDVSLKGAFMGQVTSSAHCFHVSMPIQGVLPAQLVLEAIRSLKASNPLKPVEEEHGHEHHGHEHGEGHEEGHEHEEKHGHEHGHGEKHGEEHGHHGENHGHGEEHGHHAEKHGEEHGHHGEEHGHHGENHGEEHGHHGEGHGEEHGEKLIAPEVFDELEKLFVAECMLPGPPIRPSPPVAPSHGTLQRSVSPRTRDLSNLIKSAEETAHEGHGHAHAAPHGHADQHVEHKPAHEENGAAKTQYFHMDDADHAGKKIEEAQAQVMDMTHQVKYLAEVNRESAHRVALSQKQVRELKDEVERMLPMRGNMRVPPLRSLGETRVASPHRDALDDWFSGHPKATSGRTSPQHPRPVAGYGGAYVGSTVSSSTPPSSKASVHSPSSSRKPLNKHVEELQKLAAEMRGWGSN